MAPSSDRIAAHVPALGSCRVQWGPDRWRPIRVGPNPRMPHRPSPVRGAVPGSAIRPADRPLDPPKTVSPVLSVPDRGDARLADAGRVTIAEPL